MSKSAFIEGVGQFQLTFQV